MSCILIDIFTMTVCRQREYVKIKESSALSKTGDQCSGMIHALDARCELARAQPNRFRICLLNHSDTLSSLDIVYCLVIYIQWHMLKQNSIEYKLYETFPYEENKIPQIFLLLSFEFIISNSLILLSVLLVKTPPILPSMLDMMVLFYITVDIVVFFLSFYSIIKHITRIFLFSRSQLVV